MVELDKIYQGDSKEVLKTFPDETFDCCVTSPPYWGLRDYGIDSQLGLEKAPEKYVTKMVEVFREVKRVLKKDGTLWLNIGDSYCANVGKEFKPDGGRQRGTLGNKNPLKHPTKPKDLVGIPWRVAFALQADGWYLRQDIIWHKPNPMPESVKDRCTKAHEYIFLLSKSSKYYYDADAIREPAEYGYKSYEGDIYRSVGNEKKQPKHNNKLGKREHHPETGRNKRSVWTVTTKPFSEAHFATFPPDLITPCILTTRKNAVILDPFMGAGTVAVVAKNLNRNYVGIELNQEYINMANKRINEATRQMRIW